MSPSKYRPRKRRKEWNFWEVVFAIAAALAAIFFIGSLIDSKDDKKRIGKKDDPDKKLNGEEEIIKKIEKTTSKKKERPPTQSLTEEKVPELILFNPEAEKNDEENEYQEKEAEQDKKTGQLKEENRLRKELQDKKEQILGLEVNKEQLQKREKFSLLIARILIALLIIAVNVWYFVQYNTPFVLVRQVAVNTSIILLYTFITFIIYGSIQAFTKNTKQIYVNLLSKRNMHSYSELNILIEERDELKKKLALLNKKQS